MVIRSWIRACRNDESRPGASVVAALGDKKQRVRALFCLGIIIGFAIGSGLPFVVERFRRPLYAEGTLKMETASGGAPAGAYIDHRLYIVSDEDGIEHHVGRTIHVKGRLGTISSGGGGRYPALFID